MARAQRTAARIVPAELAAESIAFIGRRERRCVHGSQPPGSRVTNEDGLHVIDCFDTDDFGVGHHRQLPGLRIRCSLNVAPKPLRRLGIGREDDEHALAAPHGNDDRINDFFRLSAHDNIDGTAHRAKIAARSQYRLNGDADLFERTCYVWCWKRTAVVRHA